jgi:anti-anti-sigma factor
MLEQDRRAAVKISTSLAENDVVLIEIEGEVDAHTARKLDKTLNDLLTQGHSRLVLDASQMGFISSAGLRSITFAQREAQQQGGEVRVFGLNAQVRRVFEMAGLEECLHLSDTRQEAMEGW